MAILPLRRLGDIGIITDVSPYDLPPNALSQGNNLRFTNGKISRSPVFKTILATTAATPVFTFTFSLPGDTDKIGIIGSNGSIHFNTGGVETDVTPATFIPTVSMEPHTYCFLSNVGYVNRNTAVPMYYRDGSIDFEPLPYWPVTYTCKALRAFKSFLIAINITKGGFEYPTMVKWSDITTINTYPGSWDETDATKSAGEVPLDEAASPLLDGLPLRDAFILYTDSQVHLMEYTADHSVFGFRKLFDSQGIINTNCVVEVEGLHYVFGPKDIYVHDGIRPTSILRGKNHNYVYGNIIYDDKATFFVTHNPDLTEIHFCYTSADSQANFVGTDYPNKAAVFNYSNGTWAFRDLPNSGSATTASLSTSMTYDTSSPLTYATIGGSYADLTDSSKKAMFFVGAINTAQGLTASRLYGYDLAYGGVLSQAINTAATKTAYAERIGVDLDEGGEQIRAYKVVNTLYPQGNALSGTLNMGFSFAASEYADQYPTFSSIQYFDPVTAHKVNTRIGGRYLAWKMTNSSNYDHELSGFDVDVMPTGRR